jgi:4-amino-4-deoxy-L-arabinose transferase-like glycosyltransferase
LGAAAATAAIRRRARILRPFAHPLGILLFAAVTVPWYVAVDARIPGLLSDLVRRRLFGGMASSADFHAHGPWTVWLPLLGAFPWIGVLPAAIRGFVGTGRWRDGPGLPLALLAVSAPLLFTFSASRLASYASPAYPFLALLVALGPPTLDAPSPRLPRTGSDLWRSALGVALAALGVAGAAAFVLGSPATTVAVAAACGAAAVAATCLPRPAAARERPVVRAAVAGALLMGAAAAVVAASPERVGSVKALPAALVRHRASGEPFAVTLNYNGDWGVTPWYLRSEVTFFGYPSEPMMVAPEAFRPDLFRPAEALVPWLREPGRRWLMLRPRDRRRLAAQGIALHVVATVHEYELATTVPLPAGG